MSDKDKFSAVNRRSVLRLIGTSGLVGTIGIGQGKEEEIEWLKPGTVEVPYPEVEYITISDEIKDLDIPTILITGNKKATTRYIDYSGSDKPTKENAKDHLKNIWRQYPLSEETKGRETKISLSERATSDTNLASTSRSKMTTKDVSELVSLGGESYLAENSDDIQLLWTPNRHGDMTRLAATQLGFSHVDTAADAAPVPDSWNDSGFWQGFNHYYNPSTRTGHGHENFESYINRAASFYQLGGEKVKGARNLGYATHYMQDLGQPLHTGRELDQRDHQWVHHTYEGHMAQNWGGSRGYKSSAKYTGGAYAISNPERAAKDCARYSHLFVDTIYNTVYNNPDSFQNDSDLVGITHNCITESQCYVKGAVDYVVG